MIRYRKDGTIETGKIWNLTSEDYQEIIDIIDGCKNQPVLEKAEGLWIQQGSSNEIENKYKVVDHRSRRGE